MKHQSILKQALLFNQETAPTHSKIKQLYEKAILFQEEVGAVFIYSKARTVAKIVDETLFFQFLDELVPNQTIRGFDDINSYLKPSKSRADSISNQGDSKSHYAKVFNQTLLYKKRGSPAQLFTAKDIGHIETIDEDIVAIENAESFLTIQDNNYFSSFDHFIYLGGHANSLTSNFLKNRTLLFFVDFDIISMNLYDDFQAKAKRIFIADDLEIYFKETKNQTLYKKQRPYLRESYSPNAQRVIDLILKYSAVVEQEIIQKKDNSSSLL